MTPGRESVVAAELQWYWAEAEREVGDLRSNFEAMRARMEHGSRQSGGRGIELDERCVDAATREKQVRRALARVPERETLILAHAFGPHAREIPAFGRATGVVPLTRVARRTWAASGTKRTLEDWLACLVMRVHAAGSQANSRDTALLRAICLDAERLLHRALATYAACREHVRR